MPFNKEVFENLSIKYNTKVFVETGSYIGDTIDWAKDRFEEVHSVELDRDNLRRCIRRFIDKDNVWIYYGDSGKVLGNIVDNLTKRTMFWLDAHHSAGTGVIPPVIQEIRFIGTHIQKNHIILIDDMRLFNKDKKDAFSKVTHEDMIKEIKLINKDYEIKIEDDRLHATIK